MTDKEFNDKYAKYLEPRHYGLNIGLESVAKYLDKEFELISQYPGFSYSQIKMKFNHCRFYCEGVSDETIARIERQINRLCKENSQS